MERSSPDGRLDTHARNLHPNLSRAEQGHPGISLPESPGRLHRQHEDARRTPHPRPTAVGNGANPEANHRPAVLSGRLGRPKLHAPRLWNIRENPPPLPEKMDRQRHMGPMGTLPQEHLRPPLLPKRPPDLRRNVRQTLPRLRHKHTKPQEMIIRVQLGLARRVSFALSP